MNKSFTLVLCILLILFSILYYEIDYNIEDIKKNFQREKIKKIDKREFYIEFIKENNKNYWSKIPERYRDTKKYFFLKIKSQENICDFDNLIFLFKLKNRI